MFHCLIARLLRHKMIWDNFECRWIHVQSHIVHPRHKTVRSLFYPTYLFDIFRPGKDQNIHQVGDFVSNNNSLSSYHIYNSSLVTNQSETNCKEEGSSHNTLSHIFSVLKRSGTYFSCHGLTSTAPSHIFFILR